jgi:hypothetical protein
MPVTGYGDDYFFVRSDFWLSRPSASAAEHKAQIKQRHVEKPGIMSKLRMMPYQAYRILQVGFITAPILAGSTSF